jgi:P27 family predicted phage terminase small subunit
MGTLCTSDRSVIALYVHSWARWVQAEGEIARSGPIVKAPKTNTPMHNPWATVSANAHAQAVKLLAELGLTPRSRSIIAHNTSKAAGTVSAEQPADDFADLD